MEPPLYQLEDHVRTVLAALYLRGGPFSGSCSPRLRSAVEGAIRRNPVHLHQLPSLLRREGLSSEAAALEQTARVQWASVQLRHRLILTHGDPEYPSLWRSRLRASSPPVLWKRGEFPDRPLLTIVGGRSVGRALLQVAAQVSEAAKALGHGVLSGGAAGVDEASNPDAVLLPFGLRHYSGDLPALSLCPPESAFSTAAAMERNALLYAASSHTVVIGPRFREGGTWHGAVNALRRRLCTVIVLDDGTRAVRALIALGAQPLEDPRGLLQAMEKPPLQPSLPQSTTDLLLT